MNPFRATIFIRLNLYRSLLSPASPVCVPCQHSCARHDSVCLYESFPPHHHLCDNVVGWRHGPNAGCTERSPVGGGVAGRCGCEPRCKVEGKLLRGVRERERE